MDYPGAARVGIFYAESERLIRYLITIDQAHFLSLLDAIGNGEAFDTARPRGHSLSAAKRLAGEGQFFASRIKVPN